MNPTDTKDILTNRFSILTLLGSGGMGKVYKVLDKELGIEIALKLLISEDEVLVNRLRNELLVARKLSHPNIVRLHDFGRTEDGKVFISMEYVEGESLRGRLERAKRQASKPEGALGSGLVLDEAVSLLRQVCEGLLYGHRKGVVHRDIKPENILISLEGDVKIADFGLARNMYLTSGFTLDGQTIGTPYYMAPEQVRAEKVGPPADMYAVGILAYELCTGEPPFDGDNAMAVAYKHLTDEPPLDRLSGAGAPDWLISLIGSLLVKQADLRTTTAADVLKQLAGEGSTYSFPQRSAHETGVEPSSGATDDTKILGESEVGVQSVKTVRCDAEAGPAGGQRPSGVDIVRACRTSLTVARRKLSSVPLSYRIATASVVVLAAVGIVLRSETPLSAGNVESGLAQNSPVQQRDDIVASPGHALAVGKTYLVPAEKETQELTFDAPSGSLVTISVKALDGLATTDLQLRTPQGALLSASAQPIKPDDTEYWNVHVTREMEGRFTLAMRTDKPLSVRTRVTTCFDGGSEGDAGASLSSAVTVPVGTPFFGEIPDGHDVDVFRFDAVQPGRFGLKVRTSDFSNIRVALSDQKGNVVASADSRDESGVVNLSWDNPRSQPLFATLKSVEKSYVASTYSISSGAQPKDPLPVFPPFNFIGR